MAVEDDNMEFKGEPGSRREEKRMRVCIIGLQAVQKMVRERITTSVANVFLTGESGTGKEVVARYIHETSPRGRRKFIGIDCATLPSGLVESELFGHVRGAFTGADRTKRGLFEEARDGTIFLDEIAEVGLDVQVKLLRVLQERTFKMVGATAFKHTNARVISATNMDVDRALANGKLREDLYHRLNVINIHLPPLRDRKQDIPVLVAYFLDKYATVDDGTRRKMTVSPRVMDALMKYSWLGNIRELENVIQRFYVLAKDGEEEISCEALPDHIIDCLKGQSERVGLEAEAQDHAAHLKKDVPEDLSGENLKQAMENAGDRVARLIEMRLQTGDTTALGLLDNLKKRVAGDLTEALAHNMALAGRLSGQDVARILNTKANGHNGNTAVEMPAVSEREMDFKVVDAISHLLETCVVTAMNGNGKDLLKHLDHLIDRLIMEVTIRRNMKMGPAGKLLGTGFGTVKQVVEKHECERVKSEPCLYSQDVFEILVDAVMSGDTTVLEQLRCMKRDFAAEVILRSADNNEAASRLGINKFQVDNMLTTIRKAPDFEEFGNMVDKPLKGVAAVPVSVPKFPNLPAHTEPRNYKKLIDQVVGGVLADPEIAADVARLKAMVAEGTGERPVHYLRGLKYDIPCHLYDLWRLTSSKCAKGRGVASTVKCIDQLEKDLVLHLRDERELPIDQLAACLGVSKHSAYASLDYYKKRRICGIPRSEKLIKALNDAMHESAELAMRGNTKVIEDIRTLKRDLMWTVIVTSSTKSEAARRLRVAPGVITFMIEQDEV